ncbi:hypothetical protein RDI58_022458 [Solanum bulbocastanum]|uniref:Uncharacterized protein n=1 Tax=Solanum bulbocastanum TaxID=147425 RepID=A0AAN8T5T2_SOLBU
MARGWKKKEVPKQVVPPTRMESANLGYSQGMEVNQGNKPMERWPPLPSKEVTPKIVEVINQKSIWVVEINNRGVEASPNPNLVRESPTIVAIERYTAFEVNIVSKPKVLYSDPYMLNNKPIIVKDSLSRISSDLGFPLYADEFTTKVDRISFAIALMEMDVSGELPKKLKVEDPNGKVFEQKQNINAEIGGSKSTTETNKIVTETNEKGKEQKSEDAGT